MDGLRCTLPYHDLVRPEILNLIPEDARKILDIGCGSGRLGEALKLRQDCSVIGVEVNEEAALAASEVLDECVNADIENLSESLGRFDCIVLADVLEHLRDPEATLEFCKSMLTHDGIIVVSVPNSRNYVAVNSLLRGDWTYEDAGLLDRTHLRLFTRRELQKMAHRVGLSIDQLIGMRGPGDSEPEYGHEINVGRIRYTCEDREELGEFYIYQFLGVLRVDRSPKYGKVSIIVPCWNQVDHTRLCLSSLLPSLKHFDAEVIVIDNGSEDDTPEYLASLGDAVTVITNSENLGYIRAVNQGIAAAGGDTIITLNNDTIVATGWLQPLLRALWGIERCGMVGPVSNNVSGPQRIPVGYQMLAEYDGWAWDEQLKRAEQLLETDRLVGFCLAIRRECLDDIGVLDERFGMGLADDDDICLRARAAGWRLAIVGGSFVHHFGSVSISKLPGVQELLQTNLRLLREKHGLEPSE